VIGINSTAQQLTVTNSLQVTLSIASISVTGTNAADFSETNNCPSTLPVGASCTIEVTFTPTQIGPRTAAITITDNAPDSPQSVALSGTGVVSGPNVTLSTTSITFATQLVGTTSTARSVTLTNYGSVALTITSISFTGVDPSDFIQTNTCGGVVASTASCTIRISFKPTQGGSRSASLLLVDNASDNPQNVALSGTGTVVELNPPSLSFSCGYHHGNCPPPPQSTILTNVGSTALTITSITVSGQGFSQNNNCPSTLGPSQSCTITVHWNAHTVGKGAVSITDNGGASPQQIALSGSIFICFRNCH
jgi:hypothetical protein